MNNKSFSKQRRSLILASAAALLVPKMTLAKSNDYGILGQKAPELKVTECNTATSHQINQ